ncbi:hypothetical protein [Sporosarcina aquimarina]|uniref:RNA polymerase subunit sigma n=1 Tax=Sporosarcina aquimarina TaxID=114975 RepID=A0ABU4FWW1_9BACL|nr:hypothetical protein [Sporosarcina aquimarina]MDW0109204.1 hypothetical protein [Sporosarcina aquimarina]
MSLKAIELQIAIPKTFEAGKITEQKNQQSILSQHHNTVQIDQEVMKLSTTVIESSQAEKAKQQSKDPQHDSDNKNEHNTMDDYEDNHVSHPYKGSFVDYTG